MNQTMYMDRRDTQRILDTMKYSHQKINFLGKNASFDIDEISAHYTFTYFSKAQEVSALHISFKSTKSLIKLCICLRATH